MRINNYELDKYQMRAIKNKSKSLLIIAGAGSGKTLTLVGKIIYLINKTNIKENEILCLSFTNNAANNLKQVLKNNEINIEVLTFHKLGLKIIGNTEIDTTLLDEVINENIPFEVIKTLYIKYVKTVPNIGDNKKIEEEILKQANLKNELNNLIKTFITQFKSKNYKTEKFKTFKKEPLIDLIKDIYIKYENKKQNKIDFNDMINLAITKLGNKKLGYKYIIIDEFQDTSEIKLQLLKQIIKNDHAKIVAVGDDYQSIYRFTGSELDVFLNFKKHFKNSKKIYLKNTYRNSQELINITTKFIIKNPNQIKKKLKSNKHNLKPIKILYYKNSPNEVIEYIKANVTYLSRNNNDKNQINNKKNYMTIHKSKGLEFENTCIFNLEDKPNSLPSKIKHHRILNYVLDEKNKYPYEEERRLFYVALTRTKNNNYLLVNQNNPSIFVQELLKENQKNIEIITKFDKKK